MQFDETNFQPLQDKKKNEKKTKQNTSANWLSILLIHLYVYVKPCGNLRTWELTRDATVAICLNFQSLHRLIQSPDACNVDSAACGPPIPKQTQIHKKQTTNYPRLTKLTPKSTHTFNSPVLFAIERVCECFSLSLSLSLSLALSLYYFLYALDFSLNPFRMGFIFRVWGLLILVLVFSLTVSLTL